MRAACPDRIPAGAIRTVQVPDGWVGSTPGPIYLDAAGTVAGPPDSDALPRAEQEHTEHADLRFRGGRPSAVAMVRLWWRPVGPTPG
jgi:hypothetical protein